MEEVRNETIQRFDDLFIGKLTFESALLQIRNELEREKQELEMSERLLENNSNQLKETQKIELQRNKVKGPKNDVIIQPTNHSRNTGIIRIYVEQVSDMNKAGMESKTVTIAGVPWKIEASVQSDSGFTCFLYCDWDDDYPDHCGCTATFELRILNYSMRNVIYSKRKTKYFNSDNLSSFYQTNDDLKTKTRGVIFEMEITVLSHFGAPSPGSSFTNMDYEHQNGTIIHKVENVLNMKRIGCQYSKIYNIGEFPWRTSISKFGSDLAISIHCNWKDKSSWYCTAKIEFRLLNQSNPNKYYPLVIAREFNKNYSSFSNCDFMSWDDSVKPENDYFKNNSFTVKVRITIFEKLSKV